MIFATVLSGPTLGASGTLTQGKDFNCNSAICFGIGAANHQLFKDLQTALNRFAPRGQFRSLDVDGFIGDLTVNAAQIAATFIGVSVGSTKQAVAADAPALLAQLQAALAPSASPIVPAISPVGPSAFPSQPAPGAVTQQSIQQSVVQQAQPDQGQNALAPLQPEAKVPIWVWIAAGVAGVIVVGAIGYALRKPEPEPAGYADYYYGLGYTLPRYPRRRRRGR
jgi:hypothetical protein